ncbi:hypothetical protein B0T26DRAFT_713598 [Lasiosphaeria miniovina]|uniref:Uncharacterized protein n=1 Tax=Lasiosphaeria miniovina TaxID=1954250 RepID=A0AA40AMM7_9PEZI|nr:uncharacterized protein B0T26DRAFT_713598 [Lasiosphaeria miniovina]KAK0718560.1 hypothetical protein B0T26DRAFT_713598 [Lasiosphaeria miniovina]
MHRFSRPVASAMPALTSSSQTWATPRSIIQTQLGAAIVFPRSYGTHSSPKKAEEASAQSGEPRGRDAAEQEPTPTAGVVPDELAGGDALGRTGGGEPLESSKSPPAQPKISNASVPGHKAKLTKEQQAEVDEHNRDFESKHGKAHAAGDDKVDEKFWSGEGSRAKGNE